MQTKWGNMTAAIGSSAQSTGLVSPRLTQSSDNTYRVILSGQNNLQALSAVTILVYSTYLGGSSYDYSNATAVDGSGNAYVTGENLSSNFPTVNPYQTDQAGYDVFVTKLSGSGNTLIYSTYLGGSGGEVGNAIALDGSGNAYLAGTTSSSDFPTLNPYQTDQGSGDVFVTKLSSSGNSLIYSTYLGGGGADDGRGIAVDGSGDAYVTGSTESYGFPTLNPFQTDQGQYDADAFVTKLSRSGSSLIYSTYLGGSGDDYGHGIAIDGSSNAYVTGATESSNFPILYPYQTYQGATYYSDAFVTKLSSTGSSLIYSTYLGSQGDDWGNGIVINGSGDAYVTGYTNSYNFPTLYAYQTDQGGVDAFVTRLSSSGNTAVYSTYLGGDGWDVGYGIAVDGSGNAYVTGETQSTDFPTLTAYQADQGEIDAFVTELSSSGNSLVYSTYLGGSGTDCGYGIAVGSNGNAYVTGHTTSSDFPTLNAYDGSANGGDDAFVTKVRYFACTECGDANSSGAVDISDVVFLIAHIFSGGPAPADCNYAKGMGDANGDGSVDISDVVYLIARIFSGGKAPHCQGL